jgi:hypothetical protein
LGLEKRWEWKRGGYEHDDQRGRATCVELSQVHRGSRRRRQQQQKKTKKKKKQTKQEKQG